MGMILFGVNPVFQIGKKTAPMVGAALVAVAAGFILVVALPWGRDASSLALAQCGAYLAALVATLFFAARAKPIWPRPRDVAFAVVATGGMVAVLSPLREMTPGISTLLLQVSLGVVVYGVLTLIFDTAGLRGQALVWIKRRRGRAHRRRPIDQADRGKCSGGDGDGYDFSPICKSHGSSPSPRPRLFIELNKLLSSKTIYIRRKTKIVRRARAHLQCRSVFSRQLDLRGRRRPRDYCLCT